MKEIWKDIIGYEGKYQVSNLGNVRSLNYLNQKGFVKILKQSKHNKNSAGIYYKMVTLCSNGKEQMKSVHRLVAEAFIENPENLNFINHKDENPSNNNVTNLEWCSPKYNSNYGTSKQRIRSKISIPILQIDIKTGSVIEYESLTDAANKTGLLKSKICECCKGSRNTHGGYVWQYK